jgi:hypothetical protein
VPGLGREPLATGPDEEPGVARTERQSAAWVGHDFTMPAARRSREGKLVEE